MENMNILMNIWKCPQCGFENQTDAEICAQCKYQVDKNAWDFKCAALGIIIASNSNGAFVLNPKDSQLWLVTSDEALQINTSRFGQDSVAAISILYKLWDVKCKGNCPLTAESCKRIFSILENPDTGTGASETKIESDTAVPTNQPNRSQIKANYEVKLQELQTSNPQLALSFAESIMQAGFEDVMVGNFALKDFIAQMKQVVLSPENFDFKTTPLYLNLKVDIASREYIRQNGLPSVVKSISSGDARKKLGDQYVKIALLVMKEQRVISNTSLSKVILPSELTASTVVEIPLYGKCKGMTLTINSEDFAYLSEIFRIHPQTDKGCFIATACYGSYDHIAVQDFRRFRDNYLNRTLLGRMFVRSYYRSSPPIAKYLQVRPAVASCFRISILNPLHQLIISLVRRERQ